MSLEEFYYVSQIVASVAVLASVIYLALQVRQTERNQRSMMSQARTDRAVGLMKLTLEPHVGAALGKLWPNDSEMTATELMVTSSFLRAAALATIDTHAQHKAGLLNESTLQTSVNPLRNVLARPGARALWSTTRAGFSTQDAALIDKLCIDGVPLSTAIDPVTTWKAAREQLLTPGLPPQQ